MKVKCNKCNQLKPKTEFYKNKKYRNGVVNTCKSCRKIWRSEYHAKNKKKENKVNKTWRNNNLEYDRRMKRNYSRSPAGVYTSIRWRAGKRNQIFDISREEFLAWYTKAEDLCEYCGYSHKELIRIHSRYPPIAKRLTVDRKDNKAGYVKGNMVLACRCCNSTKSDFFSYKDMMIIGEVIHKRLANPIQK